MDYYVYSRKQILVMVEQTGAASVLYQYFPYYFDSCYLLYYYYCPR